MIPLMLLGTPSPFEHAFVFEPSSPPPPNTSPTPTHSGELKSVCPTGLSNFVSDIENLALTPSLQGLLGPVLGVSRIQQLTPHFITKYKAFDQGLCLLLACCEPQESLAEWREMLHANELPYQVIHGAPDDLSERVLLAFSAHAQKLGLTQNVLRPPPKERPRMGPCECCASAECERKLFDFLTQAAT